MLVPHSLWQWTTYWPPTELKPQKNYCWMLEIKCCTFWLLFLLTSWYWRYAKVSQRRVCQQNQLAYHWNNKVLTKVISILRSLWDKIRKCLHCSTVGKFRCESGKKSLPCMGASRQRTPEVSAPAELVFTLLWPLYWKQY